MSIFSRIINREIPAKIVYEDDRVIAIHDIAPQARVHLLIIPKTAWKSLQDIPAEEISIVSHVAKVAQDLAVEFEIESGYRFLTNNGMDAGQTVFHLHFHLLGGSILKHLC